jgi:S-DNA-T family DNA segregation ATPase FtsK/SpoIIIE
VTAAVRHLSLVPDPEPERDETEPTVTEEAVPDHETVTATAEVLSAPVPGDAVVDAEIVIPGTQPGTELAIPARPVLQRLADHERVPVWAKSKKYEPTASDARKQGAWRLICWMFHHTVRAVLRGINRTIRKIHYMLTAQSLRQVDPNTGRLYTNPKDADKAMWKRQKYSAIVGGVLLLIGLIYIKMADPQTLATIYWYGGWGLAIWFMLVGFQRIEKPRGDKLGGRSSVIGGSTADYRNAFIKAGLMKEEHTLVPIQSPTKDGAGWYSEWQLDEAVSVDQFIGRRSRVASGLGIKASLMDLTEGPRNSGHLVLWGTAKDPFKGASTAFPLAASTRHDAFTGGPLGIDMRGNPIEINLLWSSMLVGGQQGSGKSFSMRIVAAPFVLDPHVQVSCFSAKPGPDWKKLSLLAHRFGTGFSDQNALNLLAALKELRAEIDRRGTLLEEMEDRGDPRATEGRLTPELARDQKLGMPLTLFIIDEIQEFFQNSLMVEPEGGGKKVKLGAVIRSAVESVIKTGRFLGITILAGTQRPSHSVMPTDIRSMFGARFALQIMDSTSSDMILGEGNASMGYDASQLPKEYLGVGILVPNSETKATVDGKPTVQTYFMQNPEWAAMCQRGAEARKQVGMLTGYAAGERPERHEGPLVHAPEDDVSDAEVISSSTCSDPLLDQIAQHVADDSRIYVEWAELIAEMGLEQTPGKLGIKARDEWKVQTTRSGKNGKSGPVLSSIRERAALI